MKSPVSMRGFLAGVALGATILVSLGFAGKEPAAMSTKTPAEFVATYETLADAILATRKTEGNLVRSILATVYGHAEAVVRQTQQALKAGDAKSAKKHLEDLADLVSQLGTEGDNSVAGVRKRLLEGGHHSNAAGEAQGIYEEGYVVVTKVAKKALLDSAKALGRLAQSPTAEALDAEWKKVEATYTELLKSKK